MNRESILEEIPKVVINDGTTGPISFHEGSRMKAFELQNYQYNKETKHGKMHTVKYWNRGVVADGPGDVYFSQTKGAKVPKAVPPPMSAEGVATLSSELQSNVGSDVSAWAEALVSQMGNDSMYNNGIDLVINDVRNVKGHIIIEWTLTTTEYNEDKLDAAIATIRDNMGESMSTNGVTVYVTNIEFPRWKITPAPTKALPTLTPTEGSKDTGYRSSVWRIIAVIAVIIMQNL